MAGWRVEDYYDRFANLIIIGDEGVGKSNLLLRYFLNEFTSKNAPKCIYSTIQYSDEDKSKIIAHDISSTLRHCTDIISDYYRKATCAMLVYDSTRYSTFENAKLWLDELRSYAPSIRVVLIGNKADLISDRQVPLTEANQFAISKSLFFVATSALDSTNVRSAFQNAFQWRPITDQATTSSGKSSAISRWGELGYGTLRVNRSNKSASYPYLLKMILIGDPQVGKSKYYSKLERGTFSHDYVSVRQVTSSTYYWDETWSIKFEFHEISSSLRYCNNIIEDYYRDATCVMLMYDVTRRSTFENVKEWLREFRVHADPKCVVVLAANKTDITHGVEVSTEDGKSFSESESLRFIETSALKAEKLHETVGAVIRDFFTRISIRTIDYEAEIPDILQEGDNNNNDGYLIKAILIGDQHVGKSSLICKAYLKEFNHEYKSTKCVIISGGGMEFNLHNKKVQVQIQDIAGSLRNCPDIINDYYREAKCAMLVYDVTCRSSFENAKEWLKELKDHANPDIAVILVGNKIDLTESIEVKTEEGKSFAESESLIFIETSALSSRNVKEPLHRVGRELGRRLMNNDIEKEKLASIIFGIGTSGGGTIQMKDVHNALNYYIEKVIINNFGVLDP